MTDRLIPDGVELKDTEGRVIGERRFRLLLAAERILNEKHQAERPIHDKFTGRAWRLEDIVTVGEFQFAQARFRPTGQPETEPSWYVFINGEDKHTGYESLDMAILGALCFKYGANADVLPHYIAKMIGALPKEEA